MFGERLFFTPHGAVRGEDQIVILLKIFESPFKSIESTDANFGQKPFEQLLPVVNDRSGAYDEIFIRFILIFVDDCSEKSHGLVGFSKSHIVA